MHQFLRKRMLIEVTRKTNQFNGKFKDSELDFVLDWNKAHKKKIKQTNAYTFLQKWNCVEGSRRSVCHALVRALARHK